jgi:hypothetical protein
MIHLLQQVVFFLFDVFIVLIILNITKTKERKDNTNNEKDIPKRKKKEKKQMRRLLELRYIDKKNGTDLKGVLEYSPMTLGRSQECDYVIVNARNYLPRNFIEIAETASGYRISRLQKEDSDQIQVITEGSIDGKKFQKEKDIVFKTECEIKVTGNISIYFKRHELNTTIL